MRYYKRIWFPETDPQAVYYRVFPDGCYEWYSKREGNWIRETTDNWHWYVKTTYLYTPAPCEVSKLEVLVVLGPEVIDEGN